MMGARALTHLTTLIWQKQWHVRFEPDRRFNLPLRHSGRQSKRTAIHYIYEESVTRAFLARKANGETMFMATCEAVAFSMPGCATNRSSGAHRCLERIGSTGSRIRFGWSAVAGPSHPSIRSAAALARPHPWAEPRDIFSRPTTSRCSPSSISPRPQF